MPGRNLVLQLSPGDLLGACFADGDPKILAPDYELSVMDAFDV